MQSERSEAGGLCFYYVSLPWYRYAGQFRYGFRMNRCYDSMKTKHRFPTFRLIASILEIMNIRIFAYELSYRLSNIYKVYIDMIRPTIITIRFKSSVQHIFNKNKCISMRPTEPLIQWKWYLSTPRKDALIPHLKSRLTKSSSMGCHIIYQNVLSYLFVCSANAW